MSLKASPPWNVLVFPAASEAGMDIHRALADSKEVVLHGTNQPGLNIAAYYFRRLHELPLLDDPDCLPRLQQLIAAHKIDAIFPADDDVVVWLAQNAGKLAATVLAPEVSVCELCNSKSATYETFKDILPVADSRKLETDKKQDSQEQELIVDCFSQNGRLLFAQAHRILSKQSSGASVMQSEDHPLAQVWAEKINARIALRGAWRFYMQADSRGECRLLKITPRIAEGIALSHALGPNLSLLTLYEAAGGPLAIPPSQCAMTMGRSFAAHFYYPYPIDAVYIDLDETLILRGAVNTRLIALVFQCRNRGIPVTLLTRHTHHLDSTLAQFRLAQLFDDVIHIQDKATPKSRFIKEKYAVLIDDSFREREETQRTLGIHCFDPAAALCLLDERDV